MTQTTQTQPQRFITSRGVKFPKDGNFIQGAIRGALRDNNYEAREADHVLRVVRDGDRVLELGGGIGFMSSFIARKRALEHIYVIEANPHLVPFIQSIHALNEVTNASVLHGLMGPQAGETDFFVRNKLLSSSLTYGEGADVIETVRVPILDVNKAMIEMKPTVLICDIEGAEVDLIPSMDLSGIRAVLIETHPQWYGPDAMNRVFRAFMDAGMAYYARGSSGKVVSFRRNWMLR